MGLISTLLSDHRNFCCAAIFWTAQAFVVVSSNAQPVTAVLPTSDAGVFLARVPGAEIESFNPTAHCVRCRSRAVLPAALNVHPQRRDALPDWRCDVSAVDSEPREIDDRYVGNSEQSASTR